MTFQKDPESWPTSGSDEDDRLFSDFVNEIGELCDELGIYRIAPRCVVKFAGLLSAPGMVSLHYPPADSASDEDPYKSTLNRNNVCVHNLLAKMGLEISSPEAQGILSWIERFWIKTSLRYRRHNNAQPYKAAFPPEMVDLNLAFRNKLLSIADHSVRLICGKVNVQEDIKAASNDQGRIMFSLSETPLYSQP